MGNRLVINKNNKGAYFSQCRNVVKPLVAGLGTSAQR